MSVPTALITGITGQDGSYLADFLLTKGYRVVGMVRRSSTENFERIEHLRGRVEICQADLLDQLSLINLLRQVRPHVGGGGQRPAAHVTDDRDRRPGDFSVCEQTCE